MTNLLLSDFYRISRTRPCWILAVIVVALGAWSALVVSESGLGLGVSASLVFGVHGWYGASVPASESAKFLTRAWGQAFLAGGSLALVISLFGAGLMSSDFVWGYECNLLGTGCSRHLYLLEKVVLCTMASALVLLLSAGASRLTLIARGFSFSFSEEAWMLTGWLVLAWLHLTAYAALSLLLTAVLKSRTKGMVVGAAMGSGIIGMAVWASFMMAARQWPALSRIATLLPYCNGQLLGQGSQIFFDIYGSTESDVANRVLTILGNAGIDPLWHILLVDVAVLLLVLVGICALGRWSRH